MCLVCREGAQAKPPMSLCKCSSTIGAGISVAGGLAKRLEGQLVGPQAFRRGSCHHGLGQSCDSRPRNGTSTVDTPSAGFCAVAQKALYIENRDRLRLESLSSFSLSPRRALITNVLKSCAPTVNCEKQKARRGYR
ncbi:hypothetical protein MRX96_001315 [Rhipicephalus microplus]